MRLVQLILVNGIFLVALFGCTERDKYGKAVDKPTSGHIKIAVDESLRPVIDAEIATFQSIYPSAKIEAIYLSEKEAIESMLMDSARLAIVTRQLTEDEASVLKNSKITPKQVKIATGAVTLITNKNNLDSILSKQQLKDILTGKITQWRQLNVKSNTSPLEVVFDNPTSGIVRYLQDSVANVPALPPTCFAVKSNQAVIDYVASKPNALGLIGVEWISDRDDSTANTFLKTIKVVSLTNQNEYFKPYQAYMATGQYSLCRNTFIISREARTGLGSGFLTFVASDKGQRIILKAGLVPATMPIRIVEINRYDKN